MRTRLGNPFVLTSARPVEHRRLGLGIAQGPDRAGLGAPTGCCERRIASGRPLVRGGQTSLAKITSRGESAERISNRAQL